MDKVLKEFSIFSFVGVLWTTGSFIFLILYMFLETPYKKIFQFLSGFFILSYALVIKSDIKVNEFLVSILLTFFFTSFVSFLMLQVNKRFFHSSKKSFFTMILLMAVVIPVVLGYFAETYLSKQDNKILSEISKPENPVIRNAKSCAEFCSHYKEAVYSINGSPNLLIPRFKEKLEKDNWSNFKVYMSPHMELNSQVIASKNNALYSLYIIISVKNSDEKGKSDVNIHLSHY